MTLELRRNGDWQRREAGLSAASSVTETVVSKHVDAFEALLGSAQRPGGRARNPIREDISRLAKPKVSDPSMFSAVRSQEILEHVMQDLLPGLGIEAEIASITASVLAEEIESRRDLHDRMGREADNPEIGGWEMAE
ncbi:hypothetical protein ATN84_20340 [Paramesorhizobium deserti]|uniref:Uncharacterized protein n=1 Tax=Paramesorhizobium deserti TaxID=1494590 RepID=A0A135HPE2_9HYPH|nr:hypothetical protein [Paramesorhizobium deserti]KXF75040.1 hypothetical protein ATN84_20340 [Paramesorhizobium deserti]